ncbi:MAG: peptidoglycan-associated lipoprotein Pal [Hyphomonadaceae bacterium]
MRNFGIFALVGAAALATGCASSPEPAPAPVDTAPVTAPRPAPPAPQPVAPTPSGPAAGSRADFEAKATTRVFFDYDQYNLDVTDRSALQAQAAWLKQYPTVKVQIEGNADERGTREYNIALGARRAEAVAEFLVSQGVDSSRVSTISFGKDRPLVNGHDEAAWAQNRNSYTNIVSGTTS